MIGQLKGILLKKHPPELLIDVNGVGYEIDCPMSTFYHLPEIGSEIILHTQLIIREDAHSLYGFHTRDERSLFRALLKVNGIGPRLALTILSSVEINDFIHSVLNNNAAKLVNIPGIGKKTAERIIIEMKDKLSQWENSNAATIKIENKNNIRNNFTQDAISALIALGYKPTEASRAISLVDDGQLNSEEMIKNALRKMVV